MTNFAIHTQVLENYGAHSESGKYADGHSYWKFKPGTTYIVSDCDSMQNAVAFVMAFQKECAGRVSPLTGKNCPRYQEKEAA